LTRVLIRALTRGPTWASSSSNPDTYFGSASLLEGDKTSTYRVWAASCVLLHPPTQYFLSSFSPFPSPLDTLVRDLSCGEGAAIERHTTEDLQESGGVSALGDSPVILEVIDPFGPAGVAENADAEEVEPSSVDEHERGEALPVVGAAPALAERTAGVEPAGEAERAAAAKSEALAPWTQGETKARSRDAAGRPSRSRRATTGGAAAEGRAQPRGAATKVRARASPERGRTRTHLAARRGAARRRGRA